MTALLFVTVVVWAIVATLAAFAFRRRADKAEQLAESRAEAVRVWRGW